jgi:penicillin-binding protein 1A
MVGGVWIGNDDYSSTNRMTGGSLPAMMWQAVMSYAHQGLEIKPLPGLPGTPPPTPAKNQVASNAPGSPPVLRPTLLTQRGTEVLIRIEHLMDEATRALPAGSVVSDVSTDPTNGASKADAFASAANGGRVRGN